MDKSKFDEDYYLRGPESGKSNYVDYHWMPALTLDYANKLQRHLGLTAEHSVLDFGCARGYLVKALRMHGIDARGYDISEWAIQNCDEAVKDSVSSNPEFAFQGTDWFHSKDTFEHIQPEDLWEIIRGMMQHARTGIFFIVPLSLCINGAYVYPPDNKDATHIIRWTMPQWVNWLHDVISQSTEKWVLQASYNMHGLKKASDDYPFSTGFFTIKRFS